MKLNLPILRAVAELEPEAYGVPLRQRLGVSIGRLYVNLNRLKAKGFLTQSYGEPRPERGGRPRQYFALTDAGRAQLEAAS